jgi:alpha-mannosidase
MAPAFARIVDDRVVVTDRSMTNRHLAVRWDDAGNLTSIIDIDHAREIVPARRSAAVLTLAIDHPVEYDAWDLEGWTPANATAITTADRIMVTDDGPLVGTVRVDRSFGDSTASVTYSLRAGSPRLDIHIEIDWHEREHLLSMVFPLDVRADTATCDVQFGSVRRPTHPTTSWDAAKFEVCAHRYVDIAEPGFGVAILNNGRFGHGVFDGQVRVSLLRAARYPDPDADQGRHTVDLAMYPHGSGLADVVAEAERFNAPVRAVSGSASAIPPPVVSLTGAGVELDAVKLADDGDGDLIVRLHEACGDRRHVMVRADRRILAASRCNLLEEPVSGLEVGDGIAVLSVRPFELVTLRLTRAVADHAPAPSQQAR